MEKKNAVNFLSYRESWKDKLIRITFSDGLQDSGFVLYQKYHEEGSAVLEWQLRAARKVLASCRLNVHGCTMTAPTSDSSFTFPKAIRGKVPNTAES